jgi:hypothetical protein
VTEPLPELPVVGAWDGELRLLLVPDESLEVGLEVDWEEVDGAEAAAVDDPGIDAAAT